MKAKAEKMCISAADVSEQTGLSISLVRKLTRSGEIPHIKVGRRLLYPVAALEDWLDNHTIGFKSHAKASDSDG